MHVNIAIPCYISPHADAEAADNLAVPASHILRAEARHWLRAGATVRISCPRAHLDNDDPLRVIISADPLPAHADVWALHAMPGAPLPIDPREIRHGIVVAHAHQLDTLPAELRAADIILANTPASHRWLLAQDAGQAHWIGMPAWPPVRDDERAARRAELRAQHNLTDDTTSLALVWLPDDAPAHAAAWADLWREAGAGQPAQAVTRNRLTAFLRDLPAADVCVVVGDDDVAQFAALAAAAWGIPVAVIGATDAYGWLTDTPASSVAARLAAWLGDPIQRSADGGALREATKPFLPPAWQARLSRLLQQALDHTVPLPALPPSPPQETANPGTMLDEYARLNSQADVMLRGYVVRSKAPVVGRLIAWVRRNLTSHLREPYLDPTLERQVAFNRAVVQALARLDGEIQKTGRAAVAGSDRWPAFTQQRASAYAQLVALIPPGARCHVAGTGDGALLAALRAVGIEPHGCDADPAAAIAAQVRGFAVRHMAPSDYLASLPARGCDAILLSVGLATPSPADTLLLCSAARRALRPGGRLAVLLEEPAMRDAAGNRAYERSIELRAVMQAAGFALIAAQTPAPGNERNTPSDEPARAGIEARLKQIERALFGPQVAPAWIVGRVD